MYSRKCSWVFSILAVIKENYVIFNVENNIQRNFGFFGRNNNVSFHKKKFCNLHKASISEHQS